MAHGHVYFEIQGDDLARAISFYETIFGWEFKENPYAPIPYFHIETGGSRGGILQRPAKKPPIECGTNAFCCSFEVENFDEIAEKILANGGIVALPKMAIPGTCWQGYFMDTEGNVFGLFQVDANAK